MQKRSGEAGTERCRELGGPAVVAVPLEPASPAEAVPEDDPTPEAGAHLLGRPHPAALPS